MAESKEPYKDLNHALRKFRIQIIDSLPYALNECPAFSHPEEIFKWLKLRTTYKKDPKEIELFQALPTLLTYKNEHGIPGAGDCDCFTIAALALMTANGFEKNGIVLAGRNKFLPVHIYAYCDIDGKREYFDLTNQYYDLTRHYDFTQHIPFKLNPIEKKQMLLQLAENGTPFLSRRGTNVKRQATQQAKAAKAQASGASKVAKKQYKAAKKELKRSAKLDKFLPVETPSQPYISPDVDNNYIFLPEDEIHVREDYYDSLDPAEFQSTMIEEGVPVGRILELSAKRAERKAAKQSGKQTTKATKAEAKGTRKQTKAEAKAAKKTTRAEKKQYSSGAEKAGMLKNILDTATAATSAFTGKQIAIPPGGEPAPSEKPAGKEAPKKINVLGMELTPMQAGLGGLALAGLVFAGIKAAKR